MWLSCPVLANRMRLTQVHHSANCGERAERDGRYKPCLVRNRRRDGGDDMPQIGDGCGRVVGGSPRKAVPAIKHNDVAAMGTAETEGVMAGPTCRRLAMDEAEQSETGRGKP